MRESVGVAGVDHMTIPSSASADVSIPSGDVSICISKRSTKRVSVSIGVVIVISVCFMYSVRMCTEIRISKATTSTACQIMSSWGMKVGAVTVTIAIAIGVGVGVGVGVAAD
jgi:hypothetical protein